jgi:diaminohydroxyphosphoribosylaminopyrimidine deaminase/5-amino-6-(5-phosphoribosylamino)uracil reductase
VEGGPRLAAALLHDRLVDRMALFVAPVLLGDGPGLLEGWSVAALNDATRAVSLAAEAVGPDTLLLAELREI